MLIVMGGVLNVTDTERQTPMHIACEMGNIEVVKLLLKEGLFTKEKDASGLSPFDYAKKNEYQDIVDELKKAESELENKKNNSQYFLIIFRNTYFFS